jgi:hypothetical protein
MDRLKERKPHEKAPLGKDSSPGRGQFRKAEYVFATPPRLLVR